MGRAKSGYARLAQEDELHDSSDEEDLEVGLRRPQRTISHQPPPNTGFTFSSNQRAKLRRVQSSSSGVDIKAINARLERWVDEIKGKLKIGKKKDEGVQQHLEIYYSVFVPPEGMKPVSADFEGYDEPPYSSDEFTTVVDSVRSAISKGMHPKLISQGSSGSYFARDINGKTVGVFKPKDEEPYGNLNPKWTKWLHRNLFPCFFGRSCLIPNLSYVSEAAASLLDRQLRTFIVPYTDLVWLSSKAFHYDFWDRRAFYRKKKPLPDKVGSFQVFLQGYKDATVFLKEHPWPDRYNSTFKATGSRQSAGWISTCRTSKDIEEMDEEEDEDESDGPASATDPQEIQRGRFFWSDTLQQSFREELEKLVILDYIMRNTDRGLDNWMVRVDPHTQQASIISTPINLKSNEASPSPHLRPADKNVSGRASPSYRSLEPMTARPITPVSGVGTVKLGAIDNSLAFPWKHPDQWRSFPYGWLFLPVSLIGQPFSQKTRDHFLPLLTSSKWWAETQTALREIFELDADFKERMWAKQLAVLKGQAFNVVETLKSPDQGPLELTRRTRVHVWDDDMEIPVAVPLRVPSSEQRRMVEQEMEDEVDIGAVASAPLPHEQDMLSRSPFVTAGEFPSAGKFSIKSSTRAENNDEANASNDLGDLSGDLTSLAATSGPGKPRSGPRRNYSTLSAHTVPTETVPLSPTRSRENKKRRSSIVFGSLGRGRGHLHFEDDEADLGFSAAEDMESSRRKVIVERLETVKSKPPVFTWC